MELNLKQVAFYCFFLFSFMLILILGESYLDYFLIGGVGLFILFLSFFKGGDFRSVSQKKWSIILFWLLFIGFLFLSLGFSLNLPLSLSSVSRYLLGFLFFSLFLSLKRDFLSPAVLLKLLLILSSVLILLSSIAYFFPIATNLLPGKNLLYATYGHNHLASLLLIVFPISWWFVFQRSKRQTIGLWGALPVFYAISLVLTYGRVAVFFSLLQLFLIKKFWFKSFKNQKVISNRVKKKLKFSVNLSIAILLSAMIVKVFFSSVTIFKPDFICPFSRLERQLCKPIENETRPRYWRWAFKVFQAHPWFGSGPGTFAIAAKKYHVKPGLSTNYAHNSYLEALAELGLLGGVTFILLMFFLLSKAYIMQKNTERFAWQKAVFLGLTGIYLNAFFDYDWNFLGLFSLTMILLGLLLGGDKQTKLIKKNYWGLINQIAVILVSVILLALGVLYAVSDTLIRTDRVQSSFNFFPYFHWHRKIYESELELQDEQQDKLHLIYKYFPSSYHALVNSTDDLDRKQELKELWVELDPWQLMKIDLITYYLERGRLKEAENSLQKTYNFISRIEQENNYELPYWKKAELSQKMLKLADQYYLVDEAQLAANWYKESRWVNDWQLDGHEPIFFTKKIESDLLLIFFENVSQVPAEFFGQYRADYTSYYQEALLTQLETEAQLSGEELKDHLENISKISCNYDWHFWEDVSSIILGQIDGINFSQENQQNLNDNVLYNYSQLKALIEAGVLIREESLQEPNWVIKKQIADALLQIGNYLVVHDLEKTIDAYQQAEALVPWIFQDQPHWLNMLKLEELPLPTFKKIANYIDEPRDEKTRTMTQRRAEVILNLIKRLVDSEEYESALEYAILVEDATYLNFEQRLELVEWLDKKRMALDWDRNFNSIGHLTEIMEATLPKNLWD